MKTISIKESNNFICIGGIKRRNSDNIKTIMKKIKEIESQVHVQLLDAQKVAGFDHIEIAALNAFNIVKTGMGISNAITTETLLFASACDQIIKSVELLGASDNPDELVLIVFSTDSFYERAYLKISELIGIEDDSVLDLTPKKRRYLREIFNISELEMQVSGDEDNLMKLIIERGSLLRLKH